MRRLFLILVIIGVSGPMYGQVDSLAIKSGQGLFGIRDELLPDSLIVTAFNGGIPASGETVDFAFGSVPAGATGQALSASSDVTDAGGNAGVLVTLGDQIGTYQIEASAGGDTVIFNVDAFSLKKTVLELQKQIEDLVNENIKLIVAHETGISRNFTTISGTVISFSAIPNGATKAIIRGIFKDNNSEISSKALRIKSFIP